MNIQEYQKWTKTTAIYPRDSKLSALTYVILGLIGESGELANKFKKIIRDKNGVMSQEDYDHMSSELGDVLWYLARISDELGIDIEELAARNAEKLNKRKENGTISGSGDDR